MQVINGNKYDEISRIIKSTAIHQKVLLIYDNLTSTEDLLNVYNEIKPYCIFNKMNINNLDISEIFNGYKVIIYLLEANSYLKTKFNKDEFVNIFCPTSSQLLPFFINSSKNNYMILNSSCLDFNALSSIWFNDFFNYFEHLCSLKEYSSFSIPVNTINESTILESLTKLIPAPFYDLDLIETTNIPYSDLSLINLILIDAFIVFISACKNNSLTLVDVYKEVKEDYSLLDKIYANFMNSEIIKIISLNFNSLQEIALKAKSQIINIINYQPDVPISTIDDYIEKIKTYAKNSNSILNYLYIYNVFNF